MDLHEFLNPNLIKVGMEEKNKDSVLKDLTNVLKDEGYIDNQEIFLNDVYKREGLGVTGIGNYIAIPHGKSSASKKAGVAIGILNKEIKWEGIEDDNKAKVIILFCVTNNQDGASTHLKMLSKVAQKIADDEVVSSLVKASSVEDVINAFKH